MAESSGQQQTEVREEKSEEQARLILRSTDFFGHRKQYDDALRDAHWWRDLTIETARRERERVRRETEYIYVSTADRIEADYQKAHADAVAEEELAQKRGMEAFHAVYASIHQQSGLRCPEADEAFANVHLPLWSKAREKVRNAWDERQRKHRYLCKVRQEAERLADLTLAQQSAAADAELDRALVFAWETYEKATGQRGDAQPGKGPQAP